MSAPTGLVLPPFGGDQFDFVQSGDPRDDGAAAALSANVAYLSAFRVARPLRITAIRVYIGTSSGNIDAGIYTSSDGGTTLTRLGSSGSTGAVGGGAAVQSLALTAAVTVAPGITYWFAFAADNGTVTVHRMAAGVAAINAEDNMLVSKGTSFPLPASITGHAGTTIRPWMRAA